MSEETRNKISAAKTGVKHTQEASRARSARNASPRSGDAKDKISVSKMGNTYAENHSHRKKIKDFDLETGTKNTYDSMNKAGKASRVPSARNASPRSVDAINCSHQTISEYFKRNQIKPYKGRYVFKLV